MLTPTLRLLRRRNPDAQIDVVVRAGCEAVLAGNPDATRVITVPGAKAALAMLGRRYDYAFDLSNSDRAKLLILLSGARVRAINEWHADLGWRRKLFNRLTRFEWGREHQVLRDYRAVTDVLGYDDPPGPLVIDTALEAKNPPAAPYAVIHPVSRWTFKQWLPERWAGIADVLNEKHGLQVVFSAGPDAREQAHVEDILGMGRRKHAKAEKQSLRQLARLIRDATIFLGVDTVAMHVAAATDTPTVALFGPSSQWSWHPWQVRHELVLGECPCKTARKFTCDKSRPYPCMQGIPVQAVGEAAARLLAAPARTLPGSSGR